MGARRQGILRRVLGCGEGAPSPAAAMPTARRPAVPPQPVESTRPPSLSLPRGSRRRWADPPVLSAGGGATGPVSGGGAGGRVQRHRVGFLQGFRSAFRLPSEVRSPRASAELRAGEKVVWSGEIAGCVRPRARGAAVNVIYESWLLLSHSGY